MKRLNNLYEHICSIENLMLADANARKGKSDQYGIKAHGNDFKIEDYIISTPAGTPFLWSDIEN